MNAIELGSCNAIISKISTLKDGSVNLTLEINPSDMELVNKLMRSYLDNERLITCAFVKVING